MTGASATVSRRPKPTDGNRRKHRHRDSPMRNCSTSISTRRSRPSNHPLQPARYASVRHLRLTACSNPELRNSKDNMAATPTTKGQLLAMLRSVHRDRRPQQGCASNR